MKNRLVRGEMLSGVHVPYCLRPELPWNRRLRYKGTLLTGEKGVAGPA